MTEGSFETQGRSYLQVHPFPVQPSYHWKIKNNPAEIVISLNRLIDCAGSTTWHLILCCGGKTLTFGWGDLNQNLLSTRLFEPAMLNQ
jgi:hypothetical protein